MTKVALSQVDAIRRFNRFYARQIGVLRQGLFDSPFSLAEARVLFEVGFQQKPSASELAKDLDMDGGYLSRILRKLERKGLVAKERAETDGRRSLLRLTKSGRAVYADLESRSRETVGAMIGRLGGEDRARLVKAAGTIEALLAPGPSPAPAFVLRPHRPGDLGWIVHRHGVLYAEEYGWHGVFEAHVAQLAADFIENCKPEREQCWIAERDGEIVGSALVVEKSKTVAKLHVLLVEPKARGLGIGRRLLEECIRFARRAGYRKMTLWTNDVLVDARRLYDRAGFKLVKEEPHERFGVPLVGETWELGLDPRPNARTA